MGNRAVITIKSKVLGDMFTGDIGIYLHWNGGRDSVEAFLKYCQLKEYISPEKDNYGWTRLCQVIGNFLGGTNSIGIDKVSNLDCKNGDNGVYLIENWQIVGRKYFEGVEQKNYDLLEMVLAINEAQPKNEQLLVEYITKKITEELEKKEN